MDNKIIELKNALETALVKQSIDSNLALRPQLLINDYHKGNKVLTDLISELSTCDEFLFSVAFITTSGVVTLLETLKELEQKGVKGRILTTDYLTFSEPKAIKQLMQFSNITIKVYQKENFHTKGYIFKKRDYYKIIVGSSNLTQTALTKNKEWNIVFTSLEDGKLLHETVQEFEEMWSDAECVNQDWLDAYEAIYKKQKEFVKQSKAPRLQQYKLQPNKMQLAAIASLTKLRAEGEKKALLISATGTGKTYLSAFDAREFDAKRVLFVVHREQIAKQAMESFKNVFGDVKTMGLFSGNAKERDAEFLFATMQMLAKQEVLESFEPSEFDYVIIDEVHKAGATSYQRILDYLKPQFLLGMTATPERSDGFDIYQMFDHNIAYEIRLQHALEEDLLCPFHYFAVSEIQVDGEVLGDVSEFRNLVCDQRVNHIIDKVEFYGYSGNRVKGLIFCSNKKEAHELSNQFNKRGYQTIALTGEDSQEKREAAIEQLEQKERENGLDYIFTVDIFNEGVDIPAVNQIVMLRPTQSAIIFVRQLGRGLRKNEGKEYVVIIDFIGNYANNYMIPIALSGDRSYNKDTVRKYMTSGSCMIPGCSTVNFDQVSKERIFKSIDQMRGIKKIIRESYTGLKYKLGRIPNLVDFYENSEVDPILILDEYKTYYAFLQNVESTYKEIAFSEQEMNTLEYLSRIIARGKRPHELVILKELMQSGRVEKAMVQARLKEKYHLSVTDEMIESASNVLRGTFVSKEDELKKYSQIDILQKDEKSCLLRMASFYERLEHPIFSQHIKDLVELGIRRYEDIYFNAGNRRGAFILYEKYSRRDVCHLLDWGKDLSSTMYGMKRIGDNVCLFVTYHKAESGDEKEYLEGKPDYADEFINNQIFMWDSQIGKGPDSTYMKDVKEAKNKYLFIKKSDSEGADFYFMGQFDIVGIQADKKKDNSGKLKDISKVQMKMHDSVRDDLLSYLESC